MSPFLGLLKKEFRLGLTGFFLAFLVLVVSFGFSFYLSWKQDEPSILFTLSIAIILGHVLYLPGYIGVSLYAEKGKMHLWLHSPHSGSVLLLAKLLNGLLAMFISLSIASVITIYTGVFVIDVLTEADITWKDMIKIGLNIVSHVVATSIYFTVWGVFLWTIEQFLKRFVGKLRWVVMVFLVISGLWLITKWETSALFEMLTHWGVVQSSLPVTMFNGVIFTAGSLSIYASGMDKFFVGIYLYYTIVAILVFLVSGWLLGKKVEV